YGKPLSVPQGIIALLTRFGVDVALAHPKGYELLPEILEEAKKGAAASGAKFSISNNMDEAFTGADIVYPKSWAPLTIMQRRVSLSNRDGPDQKQLEKEALAMNAEHIDWECTEERMSLTKSGSALYMHCLPADISGVSCEKGEVSASVFERYRHKTYKEAGYKPYVIAAMIVASKFSDSSKVLEYLLTQNKPRVTVI
ncbi:MAG: Ornithine transcarbamylase, partial [Streblomastix strix]